MFLLRFLLQGGGGNPFDVIPFENVMAQTQNFMTAPLMANGLALILGAGWGSWLFKQARAAFDR